MIEKVTDDIFRGSRPSRDDFKRLQEESVRSIIDLDDDKPHVTFERQMCASCEILYYRIPLDEFKSPSENELIDIVETISMAPKTTFVHCRRGVDRTGYAIAAYRMLIQKWSFRSAYKECVSRGHSWFFYVGWIRVLLKLRKQVK